MKQFIKYIAVGLAGYFIGFYEMKYKVMKCLIERANEEGTQKSTDESQ